MRYRIHFFGLIKGRRAGAIRGGVGRRKNEKMMERGDGENDEDEDEAEGMTTVGKWAGWPADRMEVGNWTGLS